MRRSGCIAGREGAGNRFFAKFGQLYRYATGAYGDLIGVLVFMSGLSSSVAHFCCGAVVFRPRPYGRLRRELPGAVVAPRGDFLAMVSRTIQTTLQCWRGVAVASDLSVRWGIDDDEVGNSCLFECFEQALCISGDGRFVRLSGH